MGNRRFSNERYEADSGSRCLSRRVFNASGNIISFVIMSLWTLEHRMFVYGSFVKSDKSVIETLSSAFHGNISSHNTISRWVTSFRTRGTVMKKKPSGFVANCKNSGEREKSERSHYKEFNLFCSTTCC